MLVLLLLNFVQGQLLSCQCEDYQTKDLCVQYDCIWDKTCTQKQCQNFDNQEDCISTIYQNQRSLYCYWDPQNTEKCLSYTQCSQLVFVNEINENVCQSFGCAFQPDIKNSCRDFDCGTIFIESECNQKTHLSSASIGTCYWKDYCRTFTSNTPCSDRTSAEKCVIKEDCYWQKVSPTKYECTDNGCSSGKTDLECQTIQPLNGVCLWSTNKRKCIQLNRNSPCEAFAYQKACLEFRENCIWDAPKARCNSITCKDTDCSSDIQAFKSSNVGEYLFCVKSKDICVEAEYGKISEKTCNEKTQNYYVWDYENDECKKCLTILLYVGLTYLLGFQ